MKPLKAIIVLSSLSLLMAACAKKEEAPVPVETPAVTPAEMPAAAPAEAPVTAPAEEPEAAPPEEPVAAAVEPPPAPPVEAPPAAPVEAPPAPSDKYTKTADLFRHAGQSATFFDRSYGYAVFPTIGKAGFVVGGAHGDGRVYKHGTYVGDAKVTALSVGLQAGAESFSEIIFFQDQRSFDEFTAGNFEMGANISAVVITAAASSTATTAGSTAGASGGKHDAETVGKYQKGTAIFVIAKGGLMGDMSISGQKFSYKPLKH